MAEQQPYDSIAIIGMVGRFPGAKTLEQYWQNLCNGVESIRFLTDQELEARGVSLAKRKDPHFVPAVAAMDDVELFDASFFGISPREAETLDPQHRIFLECAWEALENAGYCPTTYPGAISVYAGTNASTYLIRNLLTNPHLATSTDEIQFAMGSTVDFLATRASYKLGLKGPSYVVQTACSTGLVAIHLASQALLDEECDMALAGAIAIDVSHLDGYAFLEGGMFSPDGHCRAFDAKAQGTIFGAGVGIVVLKRLEEALSDGDYVHAVIRGSATNNDGAAKVGYTAPSVEGQTAVISEALANADVSADAISYIETHGTGTYLGDTIEIQALTRAFRAETQRKNFCPIGSVKTNIGHLDTAASMGGFIKTVLALEHKMIPPTLHFQRPNPDIDFEHSPFYVNTTLAEWKPSHDTRLAGVSGFGIGGTNAHLILGEAPLAEPSSASRDWQLLLLSARTSAALKTASTRLVEHLETHPEIPLADFAYTLQVGRKAFPQRCMVLCRDRAEAIAALSTMDPHRVFTNVQESADRPMTFMFPEPSEPYVDVTAGLEAEPAFREPLDRCAESLQPRLGLDLRRLLYPEASPTEPAAPLLDEPRISQPVGFAVEYALAQMWMSWGIRPQALIGYGLGEYVAACLAGVFSLEDGLVLAATRGELIQQMLPGRMLAVSLPEDEIQPLLNEELALAAHHAPFQSLVAGPAEAVARFKQQLAEQNVFCRELPPCHALQSPPVDTIVSRLVQQFRQVRLKPPTLSFLSNVTGTWITPAEATAPDYWGQQLRQTIRFAEGAAELLQQPGMLFLEIGPGRTLSTLVRQQTNFAPHHSAYASLPQSPDRRSAVEWTLNTLGRLWLAGASVDWSAFYAQERRRRVPLPTYPFERQRYWIDPNPQVMALLDQQASAPGKRAEIGDWFYIPSWKRSAGATIAEREDRPERPSGWLIFGDDYGIGTRLADELDRQGQDVVRVMAGKQFHQEGDRLYTIDPCERADYDRLLASFQASGKTPTRIVHLGSITPRPRNKTPTWELFQAAQSRGLYSLLYLTQAFQKGDAKEPTRIWVVSSHLHEIESGDACCAENAPLLGLCATIPVECPNVTCRVVDIDPPQSGHEPDPQLIAQLLAEFNASSGGPAVAYRGPHRWEQTFEPVFLPATTQPARRLRERGVYLLAGELGKDAWLLAEHLARHAQAKLVLAGPTIQFDGANGSPEPVRQLEALGAEVLALKTELAGAEQWRAILRQSVARFGAVHGLLYFPRQNENKVSVPIAEIDHAASERYLESNARALYGLDKALKGYEPDFVLLQSSLASVLGGARLAIRKAALSFLDAFAQQRNRQNHRHWVCVNWDEWDESEQKTRPGAGGAASMGMRMTTAEAMDAFERILRYQALGQVVVSTGDLQTRIKQAALPASSLGTLSEAEALALHARPPLATSYTAPRNDTDRKIVAMWQELLGVEQIGIHDNFFELGGNSLLGVRLVSGLRQTFSVDIPLRALFEVSTVARLAQTIEEGIRL